MKTEFDSDRLFEKPGALADLRNKLDGVLRLDSTNPPGLDEIIRKFEDYRDAARNAGFDVGPELPAHRQEELSRERRRGAMRRKRQRRKERGICGK